MKPPKCTIVVEIREEDGLTVIDTKTVGRATADELKDAMVSFNKQVINILDECGYMDSKTLLEALNDQRKWFPERFPRTMA